MDVSTVACPNAAFYSGRLTGHGGFSQKCYPLLSIWVNISVITSYFTRWGSDLSRPCLANEEAKVMVLITHCRYHDLLGVSDLVLYTMDPQECST